MGIRSDLFFCLFLGIWLLFPCSASGQDQGKSRNPEVRMAVEFTDHAACAYIAKEKNWFEDEGLHVSAYENYMTGMALAAALARGEISVACICLVPAVNAFANGKVPIRIVAGTHKHGYGLVVNPAKIKDLHDLAKPAVRIGCVRVGGAADMMLQKMMEQYHLDKASILGNVRRMNPPKQVLALRSGQLDAAFLPEQWATMGEDLGHEMALRSQDLWPDMQGSVLVVRKELIEDHPERVQKLVKVFTKATAWLNRHRWRASILVARHLSATQMNLLPRKAAVCAENLAITPQIIRQSMDRMVFTTRISPTGVQDVIAFMSRLGYIRESFQAQDILNLRFLHGE
ncbi:MAG: ABC transporter substrate-binding protein [Desulfobacteraceae bacterium]